MHVTLLKYYNLYGFHISTLYFYFKIYLNNSMHLHQNTLIKDNKAFLVRLRAMKNSN